MNGQTDQPPDIFISYAHIDNTPLKKGNPGWVDKFHYSLGVRLNQLLGEKVNIWRDPKIGGTDVFGEEILQKVQQAKIFLSILSPRYLKSDWCPKELNEFVRAAPAKGGLRIQTKSRIVKTVKTYIPRQEHPPELQGTTGFEFSTDTYKEFSEETEEKLYWGRLEDVAQGIYKLLRLIKSGQTPEPTGKRIFLAETTSDVTEQRNIIKRELEARGHDIRPQDPLPLQANAFRQAIESNMENAALSIHIIGGHEGIIPEGESQSIIAIQQDLAFASHKAHNLPCLIWVPPEVVPKDKDEDKTRKHEEFIKTLSNLATGPGGIEFLRETSETVKTILLDRLTDKPAEAPKPQPFPDQLHIYIICDKQDLDTVQPITNYLYDDLHFNVTLPMTEGDEKLVREDHRESLVTCDAPLIFYGQGDQAWLRGKLRDFMKVRGYGRSEAYRAKAIYLADGHTAAEIESIKIQETVILKNGKEFNPEILGPFLDKLREHQ